MRIRLSADRKTLIAPLIIAALCCVMLLLFYSGPFAEFDDSIYLGMAHTFLAGTYTPLMNPPFSLEFMTVAFLALSIKLLGHNLVALAVPGALEYVATVILVFLTGRRLFDDLFGTIAATFAATTPFFVGFSTRVLPDMGLAFFCSLSIYLIVIGGDRPIFYFLGGIVGGLAPLAKTEGLAVALALFLALAASALVFRGKERVRAPQRASVTARRIHMLHGFLSKNKREISAFLGLLVGMGAFLLFFYYYVGNPLFSITHYGAIAAVTGYPNMTAEIGRMITIYSPNTYAANFALFFSSPGSILWNPQPVYPTGALFDIAIMGVLLALYSKAEFTKARPLFFVTAFFVFAMLYMNFGSESISAYQPIQLFPRILSFLILPASIMATYVAFALYNGLNRKRRYAGHVAVVSMLALFLILNIPLYSLFYNTNLVIRNVSVAYASLSQQMAPYAAESQQGGGNATLYLIMGTGFQRSVFDSLLPYKINEILLRNATSLCSSQVRSNALILVSDFPVPYSEDVSEMGSGCNATLLSAYAGYLDSSLYREK